MGRRRIVVTTAVALALAGLGVLPTSSPATAAGDGTTLPFTTYADMVTDQVDDLAYVAGGGSDGAVAVVDPHDRIVRTLDDLPYPSGVALGPDRQALYVVERKADAIVAVDLASGARRVYPLGDGGECGAQPVVIGNRVWFSTCTSDGTGIGVLDLDSGKVRQGLGPKRQVHRLAADSDQPTTLFALTDHNVVRLETTSSDEPDVVVTASSLDDEVRLGRDDDLSVSADGQEVVTTGGVFRAGDLRRVDAYPTDVATSVAVRSDGTVAVGGANEARYDVYVYPPGRTMFGQRIEYGRPYYGHPTLLRPHSLGFGRTDLFAVTEAAPGSDARLVVRVSRPEAPHPLGSSILRTVDPEGVVADPTHDRAFVGTGYYGNGVVAVDRHGRVTHVVDHLPGITDLAYADDTLWVTVGGADEIEAIDTRTFTRRTYPLDPGDTPRSIAVVDGTVWFAAKRTGLAALDPVTGDIHPQEPFRNLNQLRSAPWFPGRLYAIGSSSDRGFYEHVFRFDVVGGPEPVARDVTDQDTDGIVNDFALTAERSHIVFSSDLRDDPVDADTLRIRMPFGPRNFTAVTTRSDGLVAAELDGHDGVRPGVQIRWGAYGYLMGDLHWARSPVEIVPRGLAFGRRDLYRVAVQDVETPSPYVKVSVLKMPAVRAVVLTADEYGYEATSDMRVVAHVDPALLDEHPRLTITQTVVPLAHGNVHHPDPPTTTDLGAGPLDEYGNVTVHSTFVRNAKMYFTATLRVGSHTYRFKLLRLEQYTD